jgi:hypothetical protein
MCSWLMIFRNSSVAQLDKKGFGKLQGASSNVE